MTNLILPSIEAQAPFVSIIINCYNGEQYLRETLKSVLTQSYPNWEIIFWDNQSTDHSAEIFKSYLDVRFHYFFAPEYTVLGLARNLAVEQARGEWVAFLDCDDLWHSKKLEEQLSIICEEGPELGLVYGRMKILVEKRALKTKWGQEMQLYGQRNEQQPLLEGYILLELLKVNFIPLLSGLVRRSAYWLVGGINPIFKQAEDYDLFVKIAKTFKVRAVQEVICSYRIHDSNLSHTQTKEGYEECIEIVSQYLPAFGAKQGMRSHQTYYAAFEMRQGYLLKGLRRVLMHGNVWLFICKTVKQMWQSVNSAFRNMTMWQHETN